MSEKIIEATGEVVEKEPIKFGSMWYNDTIISQDLSNEIEDVFEEISPFAVDPATGDFINKSSTPIVKKVGKVNVHEKIQSFAKEVDLYHILEKFAYSGDPAIINARECSYGDISEMPDNLNDYCQLVNKQFNKIKDLNPELAKMVIDENVSAEDIEAKANEILQSRIDAKNNESEDNK